MNFLYIQHTGKSFMLFFWQLIKINKNILLEFQIRKKYISPEKLVCFQLAGCIADSTLNKLILTLQN